MTAIPDDRDAPLVVHPKAHALTVFRILKDGRGREYTAATFPSDPWRGCEHTIRTGRFLGFLADSQADSDCPGVLDVLDEAGDVVQDLDITSTQGIAWLKRRLDLRVISSDGDVSPRA